MVLPPAPWPARSYPYPRRGRTHEPAVPTAPETRRRQPGALPSVGSCRPGRSAACFRPRGPFGADALLVPALSPIRGSGRLGARRDHAVGPGRWTTETMTARERLKVAVDQHPAAGRDTGRRRGSHAGPAGTAAPRSRQRPLRLAWCSPAAGSRWWWPRGGSGGQDLWRSPQRWSPQGFTGFPATRSTSAARRFISASPGRPATVGCWPPARASAALVHRWVLREERWLRERFGDEYSAYQSRVPRYL